MLGSREIDEARPKDIAAGAIEERDGDARGEL